MLAPTLVQMEEEIDAELEAEGEPERPPVQIKTCDLRSLDERVSHGTGQGHGGGGGVLVSESQLFSNPLP